MIPVNNPNKTTVIEASHICKSFKRDDLHDLLVLKDLNFKLYDGEIVALLGKSGSGKSTFLRIIAGLVHPTTGSVTYRGQTIRGPVNGIGMVFQHFALMPWLTVLENVELGLEAQGIPRSERRKRALAAIDTIGMDGFESAYPKELSGGMRQRVGFARALVIQPDVLLMDEPFSALDVLTADNLRNDLLDLWQRKKTKINAILFVTHNIEEAVAIADRILIFDTNPGRIQAELKVNLPHPRSDQDSAFSANVDKIYTLMTTARRSPQAQQTLQTATTQAISLSYRLPDANISELTGLLETINDPEYNGRMDLPELTDILSMDIDALFPLTEVLEILGFAKVSGGDIELTPAGKRFSDANLLERKTLFATHLLTHVPLAKQIRSELDERSTHRAPKEHFLEGLENFLSEKEAERVLRVAIDWGRYAEIFAYDDNSGVLSLENPD